MITPLGSRYGILSPLGRSVRRAAAGGWWLAGGIAAANCVAAYQAKGAASLAASYVNLTGNATYNAVAVETPEWDATNGWKRLSGTGILNSGVAPASSAWTIIIRFSNVSEGTPGYQYVMGEAQSGKRMIIGNYEGASRRSYYNTDLLKIEGGAITSGVSCIAGQTGYYNGSSDGTIPGEWTGAATSTIYIMACNGLGEQYANDNIYVQAAAIYNATLTSEQVSALTTAMNTL